MRIICIALSLVLSLSGGAKAETVTPEWLLENGQLADHSPCTDQESGEQGRCYLIFVGENVYMVFTQYGEPVFIRTMGERGYEQVWPTVQPGGSEL